MLLSSLLSTLSFRCRFCWLIIRWLSVRSGLGLICGVCFWLLISLRSLLLALCLCSAWCWFFLGCSRLWLPVISVWGGSLRNTWISRSCAIFLLLGSLVVVICHLLLLHRFKLLLLVYALGSESLLSHHLKVVLDCSILLR